MLDALNLEDLDDVWRIEIKAYAFPWSKSQLQTQLRKKNCNYGYRKNNILCGFVCIERIFPETEIFNIAVDPAQQGKGLGKYLLQNLLVQLTQEGFARVFLEVRASNQRAIHLYETLGFNQIGERKNYYPTKHGREDAYLFAKELRACSMSL